MKRTPMALDSRRYGQEQRERETEETLKTNDRNQRWLNIKSLSTVKI